MNDQAAFRDRMDRVKAEASRMMHLYYCEKDWEEILAVLSPKVSWFGAGKEQCASGPEAVAEGLRRFREEIPQCSILEEAYEVTQCGADVFLCTGQLTLIAHPFARSHLELHQRNTLVYRWTEHGPECVHMHCSLPSLGHGVSERDEEERTQQEMLGSIYNTVPCGILRLRREGDRYRLISINPAAVDLLGFHSKETMDYDWWEGIADTVLQEDRHILKEAHQKLQQDQKCVWLEYRVRWPDGSIHWLRGSNSLVSQSGDVQVIQRMVVDVTESRELEEQLRREREMYRLAMESSSDMMYEYVMETDTLVVYEPKTDQDGIRTVEKTELPRFQTLLQTENITLQEDHQCIIDNVCRGQCQPFECRFHTPEIPKKDDYWWYRVTGKLIIDHGVPYRVVGTIRNIQQEKQAMRANIQELQMNQAALQAINSSYLGIYYLDLEENWSYGVRLTGMGAPALYERDDDFRHSFQDYVEHCVAESDQEAMYALITPEHLEKVLRQTYDQTGVEYWEQRNGQGQWLRIEVYLISWQGKEAPRLVVGFRNVTEEKKQELERKHEEERSKAALQEAYEMARRANLAKSDFLSRMSHDIRTPMNAVMGMTTIAENNLSDLEKVKDCLGKIRVSSNHLLQLINEVLDMSKIESGNTQLNMAPFSILELLSETQRIIQPEAAAKSQTLEVEIGQLLHDHVEGDAVRVRQILLNLVSNAIKYTPEHGHIRVTVQELLSSKQGIGCYRFSVEDDGIGIDESFMDKLFKPFERAEDSRVSTIQGTGLGLAITQNLAHMMNGTIEVESSPGSGSRFWATIYLKLTDKSQTASPQEPISLRQHAPEHPWRILLVDDNGLNREIARELLEMEGLLVDEAENGQAAVKTFQDMPQGYYDLVLMDVQMPVMDGYEATRRIRRLNRPDAGTVPIIALTANAFADDILAAKQAGMNMHLSKPFDPQQMLEVLNGFLQSGVSSDLE